MNPYRQLDENAQKAAEEADKEKKRLAELSMFGVRQASDGQWKPILQRVETNRCRDCSGFGTYGNPFCGAVYNCDRCNGTGYDPDPATLPKPKSEPAPEPTSEPTLSFWQKTLNWIRGSK